VPVKPGQIIRTDEFWIITNLKYVYRNFGSLKQTPIWGISHMKIKELYNISEFQKNNIALIIKATMHFLKYHGDAFISIIKDASKENTGATIRNHT